MTVHSDVAETVDAMLRGDPVAPELRWRDEEGVHRSQGRPRPSPREQLGQERFAGLVGDRFAVADGARLARRRGAIDPAAAIARPSAARYRPGYRAGAVRRLAADPRVQPRVLVRAAPAQEGGLPGTMPGERFARTPESPVRRR